MSNPNLTEIVAIIDESGSMFSIKDDTIGGFNGFLEAQREYSDGQALFTIVTFSSSVRVIMEGREAKEVESLSSKNYRPSGGTALLDAIGEVITKIEDRYTDEEDPSKIAGKVIVAIITDGEENSSRSFVKSQISKMIKHQTNRHGWEFVFMGANLDSVAEASSIGINSKSALNFEASSRGISDSYGVLNNATMGFRSSGQATYDIAGTSLESMNTDKSQGINKK